MCLLCLKPPPCKLLSRAVSVTVFFTWGGWWGDEPSECQGHTWGQMGFAFQHPAKHQCKNLPAAGKFQPFAPAAPSKPAEQSLLRFSGPGVLQGLGLVPVWQKMPFCHPEPLRGHCLRTAVGWGFCTQDSEQAPGVMDLSWAHGTAQAPQAALVCVEQSQGSTVHLELMGFMSPGGSEQPSPLRATARRVFPTAPLFSSLPYLCCSFL